MEKIKDEALKYNNISEEDLTALIEETFPVQAPGDPGYIGHVSGGTYQIGEGCFTGRGGWLQFNKALREAAEDMVELSIID